jgi:prepilin signal peptidase PulO-like enzyme (type II secretory pathway)
MIGAGFLLLLWTLSAGPWIHVILGAAVVVSAALLIVSWRRASGPDWRALWATGLTAAIALARLSMPAAGAIRALVALIIGITLVSGAGLGWSVRREAGAKLARSPAALASLLGATLAIPLGWIPLVGSVPLLTLAAAGAGAAELALTSLANAMASAGAPPRQGREIARSMLLGVAGAATRMLAGRTHAGIAASAIALAALTWLGVETLERLGRIRRLGLAATPSVRE